MHIMLHTLSLLVVVLVLCVTVGSILFSAPS